MKRCVRPALQLFKNPNVTARFKTHLVRTPFDDMFAPSKFFNDAFSALERELNPASRFNRNAFAPLMDIKENEQQYSLHVEMPGVAKEHVKIEFDPKERILTLTGQIKEEKENNSEKYHSIERRVGTFARSVRLPEHTDPQQIKAELKDGVLNVNIPKVKAEPEKKVEIPIN